MYRTIQVSSCVSVQGDVVKLLANGEMLIRDGSKVYRGRPVGKERLETGGGGVLREAPGAGPPSGRRGLTGRC